MGNRNNRERDKQQSVGQGRTLQVMTLDAFVASIAGGVHTISPVAREPETGMSQWVLYLVSDAQGERTRHLVGSANGEGRVSSPITEIDVGKRTAKTESGRLYQLVGNRGCDLDGEYLFEVWMQRTQTAKVRNITPALQRLLDNRKAGFVTFNPLRQAKPITEKAAQ